MKKTLQELAEFVGGRVAGDPSVLIQGLDNIEGAGPRDLTFAVEPLIDEARSCKAAAVMLPEGTGDFPKPALYVEEPRAAFARLLELFTPKLDFPAGVSDKACGYRRPCYALSAYVYRPVCRGRGRQRGLFRGDGSRALSCRQALRDSLFCCHRFGRIRLYDERWRPYQGAAGGKCGS